MCGGFPGRPKSAARRAGEVLASGLLDHYKKSLAEIREVGYVGYWIREFRPYLERCCPAVFHEAGIHDRAASEQPKQAQEFSLERGLA